MKIDKQNVNLIGKSCVYNDRWHCKELNIFLRQKYNCINKLIAKRGRCVTDIGNINTNQLETIITTKAVVFLDSIANGMTPTNVNRRHPQVLRGIPPKENMTGSAEELTTE